MFSQEVVKTGIDSTCKPHSVSTTSRLVHTLCGYQVTQDTTWTNYRHAMFYQAPTVVGLVRLQTHVSWSHWWSLSGLWWMSGSEGWTKHAANHAIYGIDRKLALKTVLKTCTDSFHSGTVMGCCTLSNCNSVWPVSWGDIFRCRCLHVRANRLWVAILICPSISVFLAAVVWILIHSDSLKVETWRKDGRCNTKS